MCCACHPHSSAHICRKHITSTSRCLTVNTQTVVLDNNARQRKGSFRQHVRIPRSSGTREALRVPDFAFLCTRLERAAPEANKERQRQTKIVNGDQNKEKNLQPYQKNETKEKPFRSWAGNLQGKILMRNLKDRLFFRSGFFFCMRKAPMVVVLVLKGNNRGRSRYIQLRVTCEASQKAADNKVSTISCMSTVR